MPLVHEIVLLSALLTALQHIISPFSVLNVDGLHEQFNLNNRHNRLARVHLLGTRYFAERVGDGDDELK